MLRRIRVSFGRAVGAAVLLGGLFALLFFVLLPRGGSDGSVRTAILVDTPPGATSASVGVHEGRLAQDFEASDLDELRFRLSDLRGRPVVINFWATWCTSCLSEMPVLEQQRLAHQDDRLAIVAVNVGEGLGDAREFIEALDLDDFAVAMDPDLTIADAYSVRGLPYSVFVDASGVIQAEYQGQLDDDIMQRFMRAAIDATSGGEVESRLRLVTTVPRESLLEVTRDENDRGLAFLQSRRFRCDEDYCGGEAIAAAARGVLGVTDVRLRSDGPVPVLVISFDTEAVAFEQVVAVVAGVLRGLPDPLYTRELEVRYAGE